MISGDAGGVAEAQLLYIVAWSLLLLGSWTFLGGILDLLVEEDHSKKWYHLDLTQHGTYKGSLMRMSIWTVDFQSAKTFSS